jgi:DNA-binding MarR family transcriptional regulator
MTRWLTDDEQATWRAFMMTQQLLAAELDRQLQRDAGMPHTYYSVLVTLSERPDKTLRLSELADALGYSLSRLSHAIARMEEAGWLRRRPCSDDRRTTWAVLTPEGLAALAAAAPGHVQAVRENLFDDLTAEQVGQLRVIFEKTLVRLRARRSPYAAAPAPPC